MGAEDEGTGLDPAEQSTIPMGTRTMPCPAKQALTPSDCGYRKSRRPHRRPIHSATSTGVNELLRTGAATVASSVEHINYQEGVR